ncbi:MAG: transposase [Desulfatirhabdiaceae bacterium]
MDVLHDSYRDKRLDVPSVLHHFMIRGTTRRKIFMNDRDREDFLERLSKLLIQTRTLCYAWVLMPNHVHFLFRSGICAGMFWQNGWSGQTCDAR